MTENTANSQLQPSLGSYKILGNENGPTVLFLHGFLGNKEEWAKITGRLHADYQTIAVDLPGHGEALFEEASCYDMKTCAARIIVLIQALNLTDVHLVGYSMGGRLALYLAVAYPKFFQRVLLVSASPGIEDQAERQARIKADFALARSLEKDDFRLFLKKWYDTELFASLKKQPELLAQIIDRRRHNSPRHLALSLDHMGAGQQCSLWQDLAGIQVPLDLVVGVLDAKFSEIGEKMSQRNLTRIKLHKIEKAGHAVHLENESAFYELFKKP